MAKNSVLNQTSAVQSEGHLPPVTFHGDTIFCSDYQGQPYTPMKPIVENMGLDWATQFRKLKSNAERWGIVMMTTPPSGSNKGITMIVIPSEGGEQLALCMPVRKLPAFFASINPKKVREELRPKIELYQDECDNALWDYWTKGHAQQKTKRTRKALGAGLPPAKPQHPFDRLGLTDWEKVQMGPHIRRIAEDERELGPKTVECILLKARYLKAIEDVHRLGNALFADLGKTENGVTKVVHQAVNKTRTLADPFFDTLYDDRYRLVKIAGDFFDTACRAINSRICLARMMGL